MPQTFTPAFGLGSPHLQTVFAHFARRHRPTLRRERHETPDGDFFDVDWHDAPEGAPTLIILHGLEGSSRSGYVGALVRELGPRGWRVGVLNARSCSGEPNRQAKSYSSGDFRDLEWLAPKVPQPLYAVGYSLGASALLNYLAQRASAGHVRAAAAVSAPYDLQACANTLDSGRGFSPIYLRHFLATMKVKALQKAKQFPGALDERAITAAQTIRDFDHVVTAKLFGFSSAEDYYARCSAGPQLRHVKTTALLLSSSDDALAPPGPLHAYAEGNALLEVQLTSHGGHCGFVAGSVARPSFWAEARVASWLEGQRR